MDNPPSSLQNQGITPIPFEVLEQIFLELPLKSRRACLTVCKNWHSAAIAALYRSISTTDMANSDPSLTPFKKHVHHIKEIEWRITDHFRPRLEDIMQFLTPQSSLSNSEAPCSPRLSSLNVYVHRGADDEIPIAMQVIQLQPSITNLTIVGNKNKFVTVPLRQILESLPTLNTLTIGECALDPLDRDWLNSQSTTNEPIQDNLKENNTTESLTVAKLKPPFALRKLNAIQAFSGITGYDNFFTKLPNLTHLNLAPSMVASAWSINDDIGIHFSPEIYWDNGMAKKFITSIIRHCPNLRNIELKGANSATVNLDYHDYLPGSKYNKDNKIPPEETLVTIMEELFRPTFQISSKTLNWLVNTCGSGIKALYISLPRRVLEIDPQISSGANSPPISSRDLQYILEECPNLEEFVARGRVLNAKDIADLNMPTEKTENGDIESTGVDPNFNVGPKPWACSKKLRRLVIGIEVENGEPEEHRKAWAQLGQAHRLTSLELCPTNLIPRLSHGFDALGELKKISEFTIEKWTYVGVSNESNITNGSESRRLPMLNSATVEWMGSNWTTLNSLRLDEKDALNQEEIYTFVQREKDEGRMTRVFLSMQRAPLFDLNNQRMMLL